MKTLITTIFILVLTTGIFSQPMSGNYTVGGTNPDFASLKGVEFALTARGVSGPVFINIRPGTYTENGGNNSVLRLDTVITGASENNRITFQSDAASGGNVNNVKLQFNRTNPSGTDADLVLIKVDYITIRNITLEDIDSSHTFNNHLIKLQNILQINLTVDGFILEGCRLVGTTHIQNGSSFLGTDHGLGSTQNVGDMIIRGNTFIRLLRAISIVNGFAVAQATGLVEYNIVLEGYRSISGSGNFLGAGIEVCFSNSLVRRNIIDFENTFNGGGYGITLIGPITATIEKNLLKGFSAGGIRVFENSTVPSDSVVIANNMITGCVHQPHPSVRTYSIQCEARNSWVVFNTLIVPPVSVSSTVLRIAKPNCRVFNNIIQTYGLAGFTILYDQGNNQVSAGLISDHNILYKDPAAGNGPFVLRNGVQYPNLSAYQTATGLDTNSISKEIEVLNLFTDLHLTECQAQDPDLEGIPFAGITDDLDGDVRSIISPMRGADEATYSVNYTFENLFTENLPGTPFSITAGKFDNLIGDGIAVPDYDNRQILLYHNNASTQSFTHTGTLSTAFQPISVLFYDFDDDGHLDLIAGGDNPDGIKVFWGDGFGNFPETSEIGPTDLTGAVLNLVPEPFTIDQDFKMIFVPGGQFFQYLFGFIDREICFDILRKDGPGFLSYDTLPNFMHSIVLDNFGGDGRFEVAGVSHSTGHFTFLNNFQRLNDPFPFCIDSAFAADYAEHHFQTGWYSYANSIIKSDFDGDGDLDFVTTGFDSQNLIYITNNGNFNFSSEIILTPDNARALVALDYDNDGDQDFAAINNSERNSVTLFVNDGLGHFIAMVNCFQPLVSGSPTGVVAKDFDLDGLPDIAVSTFTDQFVVLYNLGSVTSITTDEPESIPLNFSLEQNYPNPFNPTTTIQFSLPDAGDVILKIYNVLGEEVKTLVNEYREIGKHSIQFEANNLASGIYLYRLRAGSFTETKKMILIK